MIIYAGFFVYFLFFFVGGVMLRDEWAAKLIRLNKRCDHLEHVLISLEIDMQRIKFNDPYEDLTPINGVNYL